MRAPKLGHRVVRYVAVAALAMGGLLATTPAISAVEIQLGRPDTVDVPAPAVDSEPEASLQEWRWD